MVGTVVLVAIRSGDTTTSSGQFRDWIAVGKNWHWATATIKKLVIRIDSQEPIDCRQEIVRIQLVVAGVFSFGRRGPDDLAHWSTTT